MILIFFNYSKKFKEIEFNAIRFSRDFPKFFKALSVKFLLLFKHKISASINLKILLLIFNYL